MKWRIEIKRKAFAYQDMSYMDEFEQVDVEAERVSVDGGAASFFTGPKVVPFLVYGPGYWRKLEAVDVGVDQG